LQNIPGAGKNGFRRLAFRNVGIFLLSNLSGGAMGGVHVTDVMNAGYTQLLSPKTLDWEEKLLAAVEVLRPALPQV
jgi:glycerol kinase